MIDDIWSIQAWRQVQCALPVNNRRSRIITTTRKKEVAQSCCTSIDGHIYEAKPLSEDDSRILFFRRVFHSNEDCPQVLRVLANEILRKCGGLPLAIINIAGMLAKRSHRVEEWEGISKSVSSAVGTASQIQEMKGILLLSYFDLPCYLKSCLLYLSVFPEDYSIDCRQLTRAWVAEGLIPGHSRESMELLAVSCLNELINRSMIQPTKIRADGAVKFCRVHDVVLDFIVSQAVEDNFVVVKNGEGFSVNSSNKMRRLSIQTDFSGAEEMANALKQNVPHLRSIHIFSDSNQMGDHIPSFFNSYVLRVLNIQGRLHFGGRNNVHVQSFTQLKYLVITGQNWELPEQIGKLQHLETLDVRRSGINKLPASIVHLKKLVRLFFPRGVQLPDGIGNLQALEELSMIELDTSSAEAIQGLGDLSGLRFLIAFSCYNSDEGRGSEGHKEASISSSSLSELFMRLRVLYLVHDSDVVAALMATANCGSSTPPLQRLYLPSPLRSIPSQMRSLANLVRLRISVFGEVSQEGLEILASLPMLVSLTVRLKDNHNSGINPRHAITSEGFRSLLKFSFGGDHEAALEFEAGAMAKVQRLKLELQARCQSKYGQGGRLVGLHNLASLRYISASINCFRANADDVGSLEDGIRGTAGSHPNRPTLVLKTERTYGYDYDSSDDQFTTPQ